MMTWTTAIKILEKTCNETDEDSNNNSHNAIDKVADEFDRDAVVLGVSDTMFKGLRPVLEGFVVTMHEGACETGSQIPRAIAVDVLFAQART